MAHNALRIRLKNDRVEQAEALMLRLEQALNRQMAGIGKDVKDIRGELDIIYDEICGIQAKLELTRWERFKLWLRRI